MPEVLSYTRALGDQAALIADENLQASMRDLLERAPLVFSLPSPLGLVFRRYRQQDFARYIKLGAPAAVVLAVLMIAMVDFCFKMAIQGWQGRIWWHTVLFDVGLLILVWPGFLFSSLMRRHYPKVVGSLVAVIMASLLHTTSMLGDSRTAQLLSYASVFLILISGSALRLSLRAFIYANLAGVMMAVLWGHIEPVDPDFPMMVFYLLVSMLVGGFICWLMERQEKFNLLQGLLLLAESDERQRLNRQLAELASRDALTGLANRRRFDEAIALEWERQGRDKQPITLLLVDVDHFKKYNDFYGHVAGDACLREVARVLQNALNRPADLACRYGGEEFALLLPATPAQGGEDVADRVMKLIDELALEHQASPTAAWVTVSIGVACIVPSAQIDVSVLLMNADQALYHVKEHGRHAWFRACH
ncbi:MAG: GGDEF domain-containing protein [Pseudomonadales bacterium]|nr:GGDEF domain-containing protein [Pseudomonadales bacterium]